MREMKSSSKRLTFAGATVATLVLAGSMSALASRWAGDATQGTLTR